uniref:Uncharacterized protein n=1 Tax=Romanomermis culicivorax TaxID=13658 RepID=A0A915I7H6_ROMCU
MSAPLVVHFVDLHGNFPMGLCHQQGAHWLTSVKWIDHGVVLWVKGDCSADIRKPANEGVQGGYTQAEEQNQRR